MSTAAEERGSRKNQSQGQQRPSQPSKVNTNTTFNKKGGGKGNTQNKTPIPESPATPQQQQQQQQQHPHPSSLPPSPAPQDEHIPLAGFNAREVETFSKRGVDHKATLYKPDTAAKQDKSQSPWGHRPGTMANDKDFWLELRKQVAALQQDGSVRLGG